MKYIFTLISCLIFSSILHAQTDTIVLKNKDRLIGEIKKMENGVLTVETDYSDDDFKVTWLEIESVNSTQVYLITLENGDRLTATLTLGSQSNMLVLNTIDGFKEVSIDEIVYLKPVKSSFISRLDASISFGFNFTKSQNLKQFTARSSIGYTANYWSLLGSYNSVRSKQENIDEIQRTEAKLQFKYFLKRDYFILLISEFLSNDEQKLDSRLTNRTGVGKYFIHTNQVYFGAGGGVAWNNEEFSDEEIGSRNSFEGFLMAELNIFDMKNIDLLSNITFYPSFTESKRYRVDYKIDLKYDLPLDFFIKLGFTYNFDNQPVEGASKDDYVLQTTLGWEL
ncbi:DUF481 domain-containing protein [Aegicerativicinus sediminis]|uniref:DUF481 domain-containing protein n=1 Tax=Aegicerativicinus sediminis TaxID=2893202 RepID=UPI001E3CE55A|nr:DUF481 domain-containing protein [Aegicerativicinus sediminis]